MARSSTRSSAAQPRLDVFHHRCGGVATRNLQDQSTARRDRRGPALTGRARGGVHDRGDHAGARAGPARSPATYSRRARRRPARRINLDPHVPGHDVARQRAAQHTHPREGAHRAADRVRRQGHDQRRRTSVRATSRIAKLKDTQAGDWLAARDEPIRMPVEPLPAPVMALAIEPKTKGDEDKVVSSLRRLQEEDPTIDLHRDPQTGGDRRRGSPRSRVEGRGRSAAHPGSALRSRSSPRACPTRRRSMAAPRRTARHKKRSKGVAGLATATSRSSRSGRPASSSSTASRAA